MRQRSDQKLAESKQSSEVARWIVGHVDLPSAFCPSCEGLASMFYLESVTPSFRYMSLEA